MVPLIRPNVVLYQTATASALEFEANIPGGPISLKRIRYGREGDTVTPPCHPVCGATKHCAAPALAYLLGFYGRGSCLLCGVEVYGTPQHYGYAFTVERTAFALLGRHRRGTALMRVGFTVGDASRCR